jgi:hypothetical protein
MHLAWGLVPHTFPHALDPMQAEESKAEQGQGLPAMLSVA